MQSQTLTRLQFVSRLLSSAVACFFLLGCMITWIPLLHLGRTIVLRTDLYSRTSPSPNVVFMGSSRTAWAVNPSTVDPILSEAFERPITSFNLGIPAGNAVSYRLAADTLLQSQGSPHTIVLGMSPRDLLMVTTETLTEEIACSVHPGQIGRLWDDLPSTPLRRELLLSGLIPGRNRWQSLQIRWTSLRDGRPLENEAVRVHPNGWTEYLKYDHNKRVTKLERDQKSLLRIRRAPFSDITCHALESMFAEFQRAGATVLVYEHPAPPSLRKEYTAGNYTEYRHWLEETIRRYRAILLPPVFEEAVDDDFIDGLHVAPWAVSRFSTQLARIIVEAHPAFMPVANQTEKMIALTDIAARTVPQHHVAK